MNLSPYHLRLARLLLVVMTAIGAIDSGCAELAAEATSPHRVTSGRLVLLLDEEGKQADVLKDQSLDVSWLDEASPLWEIDGESKLTAELSAQPVSDGVVELSLTLYNPTDQPIRTGVSFPMLKGLDGGDAASVHYCYPRQDLLLGSKPIVLDEPYSNRFPMQFVSAYLPGKGGIYLLTCDTELHRKRYRLRRDQQIDMGAYYPDVIVDPGKTIRLPKARLGVHSGDWHGAFDAYRKWVAQWYQPTVERKDWLRKVFNFRQVFLYPNLDTPGLFDPDKKTLSIAESLSADRDRFGTIDYVHLFDWSQTPDQGRVGMYAPWHHLPRDQFNREVESIHKQGIPVGLYFEGYLVSPAANIPGRPGRDWQLLNVEGGRYDPFGSGDDYMCPGVSDWRTYLVKTIARICEQTSVDGFYIDQLGFGYQYPCHDPNHGHAVPSNQPREEARLVREARNALSDDRILYTEQVPVDVATQYQDAAFSYSMLHARHAGCPSHTNLMRFAFPDFKTIQILRGDGPIGDDVKGVNLVFYQGDGLWLVGPSDNEKWYSPRVLEAIRKTRDIREQYMDAFTSNDATPLVPTLLEEIYANKFVGKGQTIWTLFNGTEQKQSGVMLRVRHFPGATYRDAWNNIALKPTIADGWATLETTLEAQGVGCVVQINNTQPEEAR